MPENKEMKKTEETNQATVQNTLNKEQFMKTGTKKPEKNTGMPVYLMAMLVLLGLLIGFGANILFFPQSENPNTITPDLNVNDTEYRTVPITMVYANDCIACRKTNTIEELFIIRQIPYKITEVEINSEEGKALQQQFNLKTLPTALIDAEKIKFYPSTKTNFDGVFKIQNNRYIAPELNLNENTYYPSYYIEKPVEFCNSEKPTIVQFDDYYSNESINAKNTFYDFMNDFNQIVDFKFSFAQLVSRDENAIIGNLFLTCAGEQNKYAELEQKITGIYCNNPFKGDEEIITIPEIMGCRTLSEHYGTPLSQFELDVALGRTSIDANSFITCIEKKDVLLNNAENTAKDLGLTKIPPGGIFLIDCEETTSLTNLKKDFCNKHPEIEACSNEGTEQ
ncbi:MAG: hypothetical protein NUV57_06230 [archaeon]|nr:hypothetical protein [archaeon]